MAVATDRLATEDRPVITEERAFKPVKLMAVIGVLFLAFEAYVLTAWITGPRFESTPVGPSPVPGYMKGILSVFTVIGLIAWVFAIYHFIIRPWRREGRLSLDGMLAICFNLLFWQDCLGAAVVPQLTFNAWLFNRGSWLGEIPWVSLPNAHKVAEPLLINVPIYMWAIFGATVFANVLMRKAKERWPQMGPFGLVGGTIAAFVFFDLLMEFTFIRIGYYTYPAIPRPFSFFHDRWYHFHLTEAMFWGTTWAVLALLRYYRNDRGQTLVERGIEEVGVGQKGKQWLRFFALFGAVNLTMMVLYVIPTNLVSVHSDAVPADTLKRSYFTNFICGPETEYHCPGQSMPIPRDKSFHVNPEGELVPGQVEMPRQVTAFDE